MEDDIRNKINCMFDILFKIIKFIVFLILVAALAILFSAFGWIGLIIGLVIIAGAIAIFGDN